MPTNKEIEITLSLKDEASQKIQSFRASTKEFSKATKDSLAPILQLRQAWMKASLAVAFIGAAVMKGTQEMTRLREEMDRLDRSAIRLGMTSETLSKKIYGFNIATENARIGVSQVHAITQNTGNLLQWFGTKTAEGLGVVSRAWRAMSSIPVDQRAVSWPKEDIKLFQDAWARSSKQLLGEEEGRKQREAYLKGVYDEITNKTNQITQSTFQYKKDQIVQEVALYRQAGVDKVAAEAYSSAAIMRLEEDKTSELRRQQVIRLNAEGNTVQALILEQRTAADEYKRLWGPDSEVTNAFLQGQQAQLEAARLNTLGLKSQIQIYNDTFKQYTQEATTFFGDVFYSGIKNKFADLTDVVANFGDTMLRTFTQMAAQMAMTKAFGFFGLSLHEGGMLYHSGGMIRPYRAHSGLAPDEVPIIAQRGEAVLSRRGVSTAGGSEGIRSLNAGGGNRPNQPVVVNFNVHINAIDVRSFGEYMQRNKDTIIAEVSSSLNRNQSLKYVVRNRV